MKWIKALFARQPKPATPIANCCGAACEPGMILCNDCPLRWSSIGDRRVRAAS